MPYSSNSELPKGVKGLPEGQQTKWRKVFNNAYEGTCKDSDDKDACASKVAWSQIDDKYKGKALVSFSMALCSATHDKQKNTLRWKATASDTDEDFYHDNMSLELFDDFIKRIEIKELVPEEYRSTFWSGGEPYLSISHYPDFEGKAVPGISEKTYVDGVQLKSTGQFQKSKLGLACYHAICKDLYTEPKPENPIRISIAFLDWGHEHKSNGYSFERKSITDICPECVKELEREEFPGKIFKKGQLVHLALTRVPANERTSMEVEKSMTTRKEDAASIIGDELADELDEKAKLTQKSKIDDGGALVIKAEEEVIEEAPETEPEPEPEVLAEESKTEDEAKEEDEEKEEKPKKDESRAEKVIAEREPVHELNVAFEDFRSVYDEIKSQSISSDEKLQQLQTYFQEFGEAVITCMRNQPEPEVVIPKEGLNGDVVQALSTALIESMKPVYEKLDLLLAQRSESVVKSIPAIPARRSIPPTLSMQKDIQKGHLPQTPGKPITLREQIYRNMGLQ